MKSTTSVIQDSVTRIIGHSTFRAWCSTQTLREGDWIVINNSFIYRDTKTSKAPQYIVLRVGSNGGVQPDIFITEGLTINSDVKHFPSRQVDSRTIVPLKSAVEKQVGSVGQIVFALISHVIDDKAVGCDIHQGSFRKIVWNPSQTELVRIEHDTIHLNDPADEEVLWGELVQYTRTCNLVLPDGFEAEFGAALDKLQSSAEARLCLPPKDCTATQGITDIIINSLKQERQRYLSALEACDGNPGKDQEAFNEVLRIAYNFAGDATTFLRLIVSVCDLKPIVLWATLGEHYELSEAFRNLPWTRSKNKPSLKNYIDIIGDARNNAFHKMFPFRKSLRLELPPAALEKPELIIFSEYGGRKSSNNELTFKDKELVDVLLEFTRARQRQVPPGFWQKNVEVMDRSIELFAVTSAFLKYLYGSLT